MKKKAWFLIGFMGILAMHVHVCNLSWFLVQCDEIHFVVATARAPGFSVARPGMGLDAIVGNDCNENTHNHKQRMENKSRLQGFSPKASL